MAILSYIIFFIPLLIGEHKISQYVKFHTNQGAILFVFNLAWIIAYGVLMVIFVAFTFTRAAYILGVIMIFLNLSLLIPLALLIIGVVNAATGKYKPLPVIGKFTIVR